MQPNQAPAAGSTSSTSSTSSTTTPSALTSPVVTSTVLVNGVAVLVPLPEVMELLRSADNVYRSVYDDVKKAASIAKDAMEARFGVPAKVDHLMAVYAPLWLEITDDNVKRDFKNLLWIYADPQAQVTVPAVVPAGAAPATQIVDAIKVLSMAKRIITDASKQIRDIHDAGRAPGAGRPKKVTAPSLPANPLPNTGTTATVSTPLTPPAGTAPVVPGAPMLNPIAPSLGAHLMSMLPGGLPAPSPIPSANPAVSTGTLPSNATSPTTTPATLPAPSKAPPAVPAKQEQAGPTFYDELELRLSNPGDAAKIHAAVERRGYKVQKAQNVTPAKTTTSPDLTAKLAEKLLETTPETAIMQAASKAAALKIAKDAKAKAAASK